MSNIIKFDFQGSLYSFNADGWFNATEAAARFGKKPNDWLRLPDTQKYIAVLSEMTKAGKSRFAIAKKGGRAGEAGTWLHPKLAVRFAQWLDMRFAIWCDEQIDAIIRNGIRAEGNTNLLPLFLRETAAEWELRFTPAYYHALARMSGTVYSGHSGGTPGLYGQITDQWVYGCILPDDVHTELKARRQKSDKMHQWMTEGGAEVLDRQIALVAAMAASSADYQDFKARMMSVSNRGGQLGFVYPKVA